MYCLCVFCNFTIAGFLLINTGVSLVCVKLEAREKTGLTVPEISHVTWDCSWFNTDNTRNPGNPAQIIDIVVAVLITLQRVQLF